MKKIIFLVAAFLSISSAKAEEYVIDDFSSGLYSYQSSNKIPDNAISGVENFYTDIEKMAVERQGSIKESTSVFGGTKTVSGLWKFQDNTANEWLIIFSSRTFYKKTYGGTAVAFGPISASATPPTATNNLGKIWFSNGADSLWWFDGASTGAVSSAPKGTLVSSWINRIAISNISGSQSTVRFSRDGDGTDWTVGGNPTDPFNIQIGGANDGERVTCLWPSYSGEFIIARKKDTWGVAGTSQRDAVTRNISSEVGCIEQGSMREFDGSLMFLSSRGLEEQTGNTIKLVSEPIRDIIDPIIKNTASQRSNIQTTASDWNAGAFTPNTYVDTITANGKIKFLYPDKFDSLRRGSGGTIDLWGDYGTGGMSAIQAVDSVYLSGGNLALSVPSGLSNAYMCLATNPGYILSDFRQGTTYHLRINSVQGSDPAGKNRFVIVMSTFQKPGLVGTVNPVDFASRWTFVFRSTSADLSSLYLQESENETDGQIINGNSGGTFPFDFDFWIATNSWQLSISSVAVAGGSHTWPKKPLYAYLCAYDNTGGGFTAKVDNFSVTPQTMTFISRAIPVGTAITAWGQTLINDDPSGALVNYDFNSSATTSFNSSSWTSISNGAVPSNPTNPYAAFRMYAKTSSWDQEPYLDDFTTTWNEGGTAPPLASVSYDKRYWLSFTTNTATTPLLDKVLIYQRNRTFTLFSGVNAGSYAIWRDKLHFGNSNNTGYVYRFDFGNDDDGSPINSFIRTKSYDLGVSNAKKDLEDSYVGYLGDSGYVGSYSMSYVLSRSSTTYSLGSINMNQETGQVSAKLPFSLTYPVSGREFQFILSKNGTGDRLKLYDIRSIYTLMEPE